jgi:phosphoglycerol transferase MdoB-like AlkP superfamily enzyme
MEQTRFVREVLLSALNEEKARFDEGIARISLYVVPLYLTMSLLGMSWLSEWLKAQGWLRFLYVGLLFGVLLLLARLLQPRRAVPALDGKRR